MDTNTLGELRDALEKEKNGIEEELASHGKALPLRGGTDWQGSTGGLSEEESDPTDAADKIEELITNVPLVEQLERRAEEIDTALAKMEHGTYGTCEVCGKGISVERLRANPAARTCVEHT